MCSAWRARTRFAFGSNAAAPPLFEQVRPLPSLGQRSPLNIVRWLLSPGARGDPEEKDLLLCLEKSDFAQRSQRSQPT